MTLRVSTERLFSLSTFEGYRLIRKYRASQPALSNEDIVALIRRVDANGPSLDLTAAVYLESIVIEDVPDDTIGFYQVCIKTVLTTHQPIWAKAMRSGRKRFVKTLDRNDQDVFSAAGLMDDPPSSQTVLWWDDVQGHSRLITDRQKMEQARRAELLTLNMERERLQKVGITREPQWLGLDDNFAGYDVLSYEQGPHGLLNKMIEVKSTNASPIEFFVTRNEWDQACKARSAYIFHVWDMRPDTPILHIRTVDEVEPHIPTDNDKGKWSNAKIPIGANKS